MTPLHLHKLVLDTRALLAFAKEQRLLGHRADVDLGYLTHAALVAVLGEAAPKPFAIEQELAPERVEHGASTVLAYSRHDREALATHARDALRHLVWWERCDARALPAIAAGSTLAFTTRVSPTVRSRASAPGHEAHGRGQGREFDAFLAACFRAGSEVSVDRAAVYRDWLTREFGGERQAAMLEDYSLRAFQRLALLRKEQAIGDGRKRHSLERPCAVITGTLRVTDSDAFRALLARGVGRHRAFGFGMLLLRRAES